MIAEANMTDDQYQLLFEANPIPIWLCDPATLQILAANSAATKSYGFGRAEFLA